MSDDVLHIVQIIESILEKHTDIKGGSAYFVAGEICAEIQPTIRAAILEIAKTDVVDCPQILTIALENEKMKEMIETIMTMHWDMFACLCWICEEGRKLDCHPREKYLKINKEKVIIEQPTVYSRNKNGAQK